jgi:hypothetical protein
MITLPAFNLASLSESIQKAAKELAGVSRFMTKKDYSKQKQMTIDQASHIFENLKDLIAVEDRYWRWDSVKWMPKIQDDIKYRRMTFEEFIRHYHISVVEV